MSKEEMKDRLRRIVDEISGNVGKQDNLGQEVAEEKEPTLTQTIIGGSNHVQISGNNNTVVKQ
jgi:hypothetical protein